MEHQAVAHGENEPPQFKFRVVRACKTSLERQVREAVRIGVRGNVLNKKGMYNTCKLTRMVVDKDWDKKVWEESWEITSREHHVEEQDLRESGKHKRQADNLKKNKKVKLEDGWVWGEHISDKESSSKQQGVKDIRQTKLKVYSGVE